jgi:hypothetical protein
MKTLRNIILVIFILSIIAVLSMFVFSDGLDYSVNKGFFLGNNTSVKHFTLLKQTPYAFSKNFVLFPKNMTNLTTDFFMDQSQNIKMVSYFDELEQKKYVRVALPKRIGQNFIINSNQIYEFIVSEDINITIPINNT